MRVLFLTLYPEAAASPRYRVHQFIPHLERLGIECTVQAPLSESEWRRHSGAGRQGRAFWYHARETPRRVVQCWGASSHDAVLLQKAITTAYVPGLDWLLRARARRLIYDIDDAVHLFPPHPLRFPWRLAEDRGQVRRLFREADHVLAGNSWLLNEAAAHGAAATLFPTVVDTDRFVPAATPPTGFCAGWMGAPSTAQALNGILPALRDLKSGELVVAGAVPGQVHLDGARFEPWRYDTEVRTLQQFSVGLMPLPRDPWTRGKCALKALLYMAVGIPCIATPHGAITEIIRHGENGWFANSAEEWREALEVLRDPALRARLGEAARATVESAYSLRLAAPRFARLLEAP
jgi:glycosyltransferase involved in cell wall biosynthesis